jgi:hypothetical protein
MRALAIGMAFNLLLLNCGWAADAAQAAPAAAPQGQRNGTSPELLRFQLERVYRAVRHAVEMRDYPTFLQLVIPAQSGKPPPPAAFDRIALNLLDDYPVLEQLNFVKVDQSGEWAGYYTENRVADTERIQILFFKFKRGPQGWKMSGRVVEQDIPYTVGRYRTLDEIALNPAFRLPGQRGYREPKQ